MEKFLILYHAGQPDLQNAPSPEQMQEMMRPWFEWLENLKKKGHLVVTGTPLSSGGKVITKNGITDGAVENNNQFVTGYLIVQAADMASAVELVKDDPSKQFCDVEVRQIQQM